MQIILLALLGGAQAQINRLKYTQVGTGACRGNGGPADKVSGVYTQGQTQAWCEQQCDLQPDCVGYAFHVGQSDPALALSIPHRWLRKRLRGRRHGTRPWQLTHAKPAPDHTSQRGCTGGRSAIGAG